MYDIVHTTTMATSTMLLVSLVMMTQWMTAVGVENLLLNPSFEDSLRGTWNTRGFKAEQYAGDKLDGQYSLRCTERSRDLAGPSQYLHSLRRGRGYELRAYVKLLNDKPNKLWQQLKAVIKFDFTVKLEGSTIRPLSEKPKRCVGLRGKERKDCLAVLKKWRDEMKKQRAEEKKRKQQEKKKKLEEKKKNKKKKKQDKKKDKKKKDKQKKKDKNEKDKQKKKDKKEKEKTKAQKDKEKQKAKERKEKEKQKNKEKKERERQKAKERKEKKKGRKSSAQKGPAQLAPSLDTQRTRRDIFSFTLRRRQQQQQRQRRQAQQPQAPEEEEEEHNLGLSTSARTISGVETAAGAYIIAWRAFVTSEQGWVLLTGNINAPMLPFRGAELSIRGPDEGVDFLIDNMTLYEVPERPDWLTNSHEMIDRHRKSDITFRVTVPPSVSRHDIDVQVKLTNHLFAFGSKVEDKLLYRRNAHKFREVFYNLFNWATIGSFKWRFDKGRDLYSPNFSNAEKAMNILNENGVKVRAHSILWGVKKNIPPEVLKTPPEELPKLIRFHTEYMVNLTRGKVEQWDVQNEFLHGHWYEETLKDPHVTENVFKIARPLDPDVKLYLNDFTAINSGANTEDYHDLALRFIETGTGIQGLGVQGHVKEFIRPTPTMIWRRLDRLAETGLEIFLTEFDIGWADDVVRADWFEDAMRAYFAHPGLSGVILWGFWKDWQTYKDKYLVYGKDLQFAEQGERFVCLTQKEWSTRTTFNLSNPGPTTVRGFRGEYEVIIRKGGVPVQRETFTLGKEDKTVEITVTESNVPVAVEEKHDYVPQCISHRDQRSVGTAHASPGESAYLACTDRLSAPASPFNGAQVSVTCQDGEIMTSCSSFNPGHHSRARQGEMITLENGVITCTAFQGSRSGQGVRASARCCRALDLQCDYRKAGPSSPMDGAMAESRCPQGHTPLGCSIYNEHSVPAGAFPNANMTSCLAQSGPPLFQNPALKSGSVSYAACCSKPGLQCRQVVSAEQPVAHGFVKVTCPSGDVMTGCNMMGQNGGMAGAHIYTDLNSGASFCKGFIGQDLPSGDAKMSAVAICCNSGS